MTPPVTPAAAEAELKRLAAKLEAKTDELAGLLRTAAEADVSYRVEYSKALLAAPGDTVSEREARAVLATADELTVRKSTEAIASAAVESIRALRDQLHAVMSINVNTRISAGLENR